MKLSAETLRLYAVTDRSWLNGRTLFDQVEEALTGGVTLVQLREKEIPEYAFLKEAVQMAKLCHRHNVPLIINDNVDVAMKSGADGVHIGQDDMETASARKRLGKDMIVGVTAKTVEQAIKAQEAGADYLGSGAVFGSTTKTNAKLMTTELLSSITRAGSIPVVAIGGINRSNILQLRSTGISGAAIVSGIFAAKHIETECCLLRELVDLVIQS